ncbi:MAG TPA: LysR substrate-binding domain-containing protein [Steroidobacteraceae bacterium]|nr:LysR substrate-binding domain-containing protein [Steroidobacteraceae bacterium]
MELHQIEYFLALVESRSFTKASVVLAVAQPALSRQIRQLEAELGVRLFYRHGRGVRLTEEGAQFQASVEPLLRELRQAVQDLRASAKVPAGEISLGMPPSLSATIGASLVQTFRSKYPQVRLHIVDGFSGFVNEWLVTGRVDMAVINDAGRPAIRADTFLSVDLFLFGAARLVDSLAGTGDTMPLARLRGIPLVVPGRNHGLRREIDLAAQKLGLDLAIVVEIDSLVALKELVRQGLGLTILPYGSIYPDARDANFALRRIVEPDLTLTFSLAYSLQRPTTLAMRELARTIRNEAQRAIEAQRLFGRCDALAA